MGTFETGALGSMVTFDCACCGERIRATAVPRSRTCMECDEAIATGLLGGQGDERPVRVARGGSRFAVAVLLIVLLLLAAVIHGQPQSVAP